MYEANDLDAVDLAAAINAAVLGDAVYKVWCDAAAGQIRVVNVDPLSFFASWRADDLTTLERVDVVYALPREQAEARWQVRLSEPVRRLSNWLGGGRGGFVDVVESWTAGGYRLDVGGVSVENGANPYGVIPYVHVPNLPGPNEFWGRSDLADVVALNRELDERMSDHADVIRYHADPPVVFKGVEEHDSSRRANGIGSQGDQ